MPDSLQVITEGSVATLSFLLPQIVGLFVIPFATAYKKYLTGMSEIFRPELLKGSLAVGAAFLLVHFMKIDLDVEHTVRLGLEAVGTAAVLYGAAKGGTKLLNGGT